MCLINEEYFNRVEKKRLCSFVASFKRDSNHETPNETTNELIQRNGRYVRTLVRSFVGMINKNQNRMQVGLLSLLLYRAMVCSRAYTYWCRDILAQSGAVFVKMSQLCATHNS